MKYQKGIEEDCDPEGIRKPVKWGQSGRTGEAWRLCLHCLNLSTDRDSPMGSGAKRLLTNLMIRVKRCLNAHPASTLAQNIQRADHRHCHNVIRVLFFIMFRLSNVQSNRWKATSKPHFCVEVVQVQVVEWRMCDGLIFSLKHKNPHAGRRDVQILFLLSMVPMEWAQSKVLRGIKGILREYNDHDLEYEDSCVNKYISRVSSNVKKQNPYFNELMSNLARACLPPHSDGDESELPAPGSPKQQEAGSRSNLVIIYIKLAYLVGWPASHQPAKRRPTDRPTDLLIAHLLRISFRECQKKESRGDEWEDDDGRREKRV
ncbi:hypothetical protein CPC08DRAFT_728805 [Agrocybe pediades]|nr:hypothetical protein CPC08DRAFT_728805 [Agrocybe pediades]